MEICPDTVERIKQAIQEKRVNVYKKQVTENKTKKGINQKR